MYLLDTNVVSEMRKVVAGRADPKVAQWAQATRSSQMTLSVITVMEIETGVRSLERRDPVQGGLLREWFDDHFMPTFADRTYVVDIEIARKCAALHVPDRRPDRDAFIAATALVHGLTVVTRNIADFAPTGVRVLNPWL